MVSRNRNPQMQRRPPTVTDRWYDHWVSQFSLVGATQFGAVSGRLDRLLRDIERVTFVEWSWRPTDGAGSKRHSSLNVFRPLLLRHFIVIGSNCVARDDEIAPRAA